jgi:hypothetical protein
MKTILVENQFGHGAKRSNPVSHWIRNHRREQAGKATTPPNWAAGYDSLSLISPVTIKNQFQSFSCGGQAASYALEIVEKLANNQEGAISAKSVYAPIAVSGGGTYVTSLQNQIKAAGASLEATVPSYRPNGTTDEPFMTDQTALNLKDALTRSGYTIVNVPITMDGIASAIQQYGAVIWEISGQNGQVPSWTSATPQPPSTSNPNEIWNHFMCCVGFGQPPGYQRIKALQSWGTAVGENGIQYFTANYINSGYVRDVFAFYKTVVAPIDMNASNTPNYWWMFFANLKAYFTGSPLPYPNVPLGSAL